MKILKRLMMLAALVVVGVGVALTLSFIPGNFYSNSWIDGFWHGLNAPINFLISLFSHRPVMGVACDTPYIVGWLIGDILSLIVWAVIILMLITEYKREIKLA